MLTSAAILLGALVVTFVLGRVSTSPGRVARSPAPAALPDVPGPSPIESMAPLALDSLPVGLVLYDRNGEEVFRNQFARELMTQRHLGPLVSAGVRELKRQIGYEECGNGSSARTSLDLYGPPRRNIDLTGVAICSDEDEVGSMVIVTDVTEQRRVDEVRRDFVANVSHELKTPVGAISLLAEALSEEDDPEIVERLTGRLQLESIRLGNTIDDLLALSEIESDQLQPSDVAVDEVVAGAVARSSDSARQREIELRIEKADEPLVLRGDRRQLISALGNLVDNAVKYSDPGSEVCIRAEQEDDSIVVRVEDHGIGIPQSDLGRIFERFYRVDPGRSRDTGGTGLGLSIVRHVVMNHGGRVAVASTEGVGTTFTLYLPSARTPSESMVEASGGADPEPAEIPGRAEVERK